MKLVNLTKRPLTLYDTQGERVDVPPDPRYIGIAAMGEHHTIEDETGHSFSLNVRYVREIKGLPNPEENTLYIVPVEVAMALQGQRDDVVFPAVEAQVRGRSGRFQRITHLRRIVSRVASNERNGQETTGLQP